MSEKVQPKFPVTPNIICTTAFTAKQSKKSKTDVEKAIMKKSFTRGQTRVNIGMAYGYVKNELHSSLQHSFSWIHPSVSVRKCVFTGFGGVALGWGGGWGGIKGGSGIFQWNTFKI